MGNNLSQEEINALLAGAAGDDAPSDSESTETADMAPETAASEPIEPVAEEATDEAAAPEAAPEPEAGADENISVADAIVADADDLPEITETLTDEETDVMGEIGNISMGTAATTLSTLLNKKVEITTPRVHLTTMRHLSRNFPMPFVAVEVQYTLGLEGNNLLFLKPEDVMIITDLMMGGDGTNTSGELGDLHLSAISEAMNQMVGSSSTSISQIIGKPIDISPPVASLVSKPDEAGQPILRPTDAIIMTSFNMEVQGLIHSEIMQIVPLE
ncbi:flagellar motor switch phosphatase FliY, partial [Oscillospiraceae bacterium OttesenSCG-928-F05]|nr:flagellar motor switch phosphatase FliY [Oscillospiraceae bacterium OttesenSCG-928-F05]